MASPTWNLPILGLANKTSGYIKLGDREPPKKMEQSLMLSLSGSPREISSTIKELTKLSFMAGLPTELCTEIREPMKNGDVPRDL